MKRVEEQKSGTDTHHRKQEKYRERAKSQTERIQKLRKGREKKKRERMRKEEES